MAYFLLCGDIDFKILSEIMLHFSSNLHTFLRYILGLIGVLSMYVNHLSIIHSSYFNENKPFPFIRFNT